MLTHHKGHAVLNSRKTQDPRSWDELLRHHHTQDAPQNTDDPIAPTASADPSNPWLSCRYAITRSHDFCKVGSWVFYTHSSNTQVNNLNPQVRINRLTEFIKVSVGRIADIRCRESLERSTSKGIVFLKPFIILEDNDKHYNMPKLIPCPQNPSIQTIPTEV